MKLVHLAGGLILLAGALTGVAVMAEDTTRVRNGPNRAAIGQRGDPADTRRSVETGPGYVRIEQHNRNNSAVIIQDSGGGAGKPSPDEPE